MALRQGNVLILVKSFIKYVAIAITWLLSETSLSYLLLLLNFTANLRPILASLALKRAKMYLSPSIAFLSSMDKYYTNQAIPVTPKEGQVGTLFTLLLDEKVKSDFATQATYRLLHHRSLLCRFG